MPVNLISSGGGTTTLTPAASASNFTVTLPAATGTMALTSSVVSSLNGQTGAVTNTDLYAIGSYITGRPQNFTLYAVNSTIAGSSLYSAAPSSRWTGSSWVSPSGSGSAGENLVNTGTWRCMSAAVPAGAGDQGYNGVWVRIS